MILAALPDPNSSEAIGWIVLILCGSIGGLFLALNQVADFVGRFRKQAATETEIANQPIEVKAADRFATREELAALEERLSERQDKLEEKLDTAVDKISEAGEDRVRRLHARMDQVLAAVAQVQGELKRIPNQN